MELINKIIKGDPEAANELYGQYERYWFRICLRYARNRSEAQDILQEGLVYVFKDLYQFQPSRGSFKSWSSTVMVNAALRFLKRNQWNSLFESLDEQNETYDTSNLPIDQIQAKEIINLIQQLPTGYRIVFNMYEIEGYSHREIAQILDISPGTSKSQLFKAKRMLRRKIEILM